jgi:hypothetical protein
MMIDTFRTSTYRIQSRRCRTTAPHLIDDTDRMSLQYDVKRIIRGITVGWPDLFLVQFLRLLLLLLTMRSACPGPFVEGNLSWTMAIVFFAG